MVPPSLRPDRRDVAEALAFIRLVIRNNPRRSLATINRRPDVAEAREVLAAWFTDARRAVRDLTGTLPESSQIIVTNAATDTLDRLARDADTLTDDDPDVWAARLVLRMQWFVDWLDAMSGWADLSAPYKQWVSRLDPKTCTYCRSLHGLILPADASYIRAAAEAGFRRPYGGLFAPPLHPRCRCRLEPIYEVSAVLTAA